MSNEIQQGLQDDLTTIEPDLMNMTRLFSLPDSVWDAPEYHFTAAIEGGTFRRMRMRGFRRCTAVGRFAVSAVRRSTTCCARKQAFIRRGGA